MWIFKKSSIKKYINTLKKELPKRYGKSKNYTPEQIKRTINDFSLSKKYIHYAMAMYVTEELYSQYYTEDTIHNYAETRLEIVNDVLNGNIDVNSESGIDFISDFDFMDIGSNHYSGDGILDSEIGFADSSGFPGADGGDGGSFGSDGF